MSGLEFDDGDRRDDPYVRELEDEADAFANERLIPTRALDALLVAGPPTAARGESSADQVCVAPGIVVGRLQYRGVLRHDQLNGLRERAALTNAVEA